MTVYLSVCLYGYIVYCLFILASYVASYLGYQDPHAIISYLVYVCMHACVHVHVRAYTHSYIMHIHIAI